MDQVEGADGQAGGSSRPGLQTKPIRRRNRMINSCLECRKRKLKCTKNSPSCTNCVKAGRDCLYIGPRLDEASQMRLAEIKEKQGTLERQLERDVAKSTTTKNSMRQRILADQVEDDYDREKDIEPTPLAALDMTYEDDADVEDEMIDLGIQIGKMRITERIGGLSRPRISEEISAAISGQVSPSQPHARIDDLPDDMADMPVPDFLKPGSQYIVPSSGLFFGQTGDQPSLMQCLPCRAAADRLMRQYFVAVHPVAPVSHRPTLEASYTVFWDEIGAGFEPRPSTQAILFAAMFSGAISMDDSVIYSEIGGFSKANWIASLKLGTETALSKASFLRTTRVETMQAFVMYMISMCRAEVSRAHSVLVGAAVRMAECMGLQRDGESYGLTPLETHVRRLIWHQLCFLDIRTCEAQGPKPVIRRDDYDTKLPLNCDEDQFTNATVAPKSSDEWSSTTLALIRFEINEMMRIIWVDRRRLEFHRTNLTAVLSKIEDFRRRMSEKYDHLLDATQPIQRYAKCVMHLLLYRLHIMVLHPYHSNAAVPMPPRLNQLLVISGIMVVELAIQLETNPLFEQFAWYLGAYFQYQIALLLATEVYYRPHAREADRIWACLDYVFGLDRGLSTEAKSLHLLAEIQGKTAVYLKMRKARGPNTLMRAMTSNNVVAGTVNQQQQQQHQRQPPPQPMLANQISQPAPGAVSSPNPEPSYTPAMPMNQAVQPPQVVFASVSDGQPLWGHAPNQTSPENSDTSGTRLASSMTSAPGVNGAGGVAMGAAHGQQQQQQQPGQQGGGNIMDTIDWDTINTLFPYDPQTGSLSLQGYHDPGRHGHGYGHGPDPGPGPGPGVRMDWNR
ncbi:hypothetical protein F4778DRAFT_104401 [Xylariomycetidae sp. FL2044]|nr:hypothetical protein F4778DRAFT_104401 [Xylariomycetidae sp. FL2044]